MPTLYVSTDLLQLPVLALQPPARPVLDLQAANFTIRLDSGPPFHPAYLRAQASEPLHLAVVAQADASTAPALSAALQGAFATLPFAPGDRLTLFLAGCHLIRTVAGAPAAEALLRGVPAQAFAPAMVQAAFPTGGCRAAAPDFVLHTVLAQLASSANGAWPVLLYVVRADRPVDLSALALLQNQAALHGATLFTLRYAPHRRSLAPADDSLELLTGSLGGLSLPGSLTNLQQPLATLLQVLRQRYILSFPRPGNGTPGAHRIEVSVDRPHLLVRASAASTPPPDDTACGKAGDHLCVAERPQYGPPPR